MKDRDLLSGLHLVPEIARTYELVQVFQTMVRTRTPAPLEREYSDPHLICKPDDRRSGSIVYRLGVMHGFAEDCQSPETVVGLLIGHHFDSGAPCYGTRTQ